MKIHFVGIGGVGMSALAQLHAMNGDEVTGSDRLINNGFTQLPIWQALIKLGVKVFPQNGSAITPDTDAVILTSAIEPDNIEIKKAKEYGIPVLHRSELLAKHVKEHHTIAVSGTSGKSTTTAMLFEILRQTGKEPSLITGGFLLSLQKEGYFGNVYKGKSDILVIEADESDGTLVNYHPKIGLMLNLAKDHKELETLKGFFKKFRINCDKFIYNADQTDLEEIGKGSLTFSLNDASNIKMDGFCSTFEVDGVPFKINLPGVHYIKDALGAIAAARQEGVSLEDCAIALENFKGVWRRFNSIGTKNKIEVIDDFAHNPHKLAATLKATHLRGKRVLAFFQPHAFTSVQLLLKEFIDEFSANIKQQDHLWLGEIYYAGGTIPPNISSKLIYEGLKHKGTPVSFLTGRDDTAKDIAASAKPGDVILVMGARDPTLTDYAKQIFNMLK